LEIICSKSLLLSTNHLFMSREKTWDPIAFANEILSIRIKYFLMTDLDCLFEFVKKILGKLVHYLELMN